MSEPCPLTRWPDVDTTYIVCTKDRAIPPEWSRRAARAWLSVEPIEMDSGHSPFLSRPDHLVDTLLAAGKSPRA